MSTTRRAFLTGSFALLATPLAVEAQDARNVPRIAVAHSNPPEADLAGPHPKNRAMRAFLEAARGLGWVDGQNISILRKSAEGNPDRYSPLARELVNLKLDVIVASGALGVTVRQMTDTIPLVIMGGSLGPGSGIKSQARPGGNVTGLATASASQVLEKRLQLLKETVPKVSRVACLTDVGTTSIPDAAAHTLGLTLVPVAVAAPEEIQAALDTIAGQRVDALFVVYGRFLMKYRTTVIGFAAKQRLPASYPFDDFARDGGLMSYGANIADMFRRAATYVDKILKGARPGDLPIEDPNTFELVINLKTAKALGLTIPPSLLLRADQIIE